MPPASPRVRPSLLLTAVALALAGCGPTYHAATIRESIQQLAKREYGLDIDVALAGKTVAARFKVDNLIGELVAEDQQIWKRMDDLMLVLSRVVLSVDIPPDFFILDIADAENDGMHLMFTRSVLDIRKLMAEALSRTQYLDRLIVEFVINGERVAFDPVEADILRLMMMAAGADPSGHAPPGPFEIQEVALPSFLAKVSGQSVKRLLRESNPYKDALNIREAVGMFQETKNLPRFQLSLDVAGRPAAPFRNVLEKKALPEALRAVEEIFRSYKFEDYSAIAVVEKNSGKILIAERGGA